MNTSAMARLLAELIEPQVETGQHGEIAGERLRQALTFGPTLTKKEQSVLLLSPVAREDYKKVRKEIVAEIRDRIKQRNITMDILPLAAATQDEKVSLTEAGFTVTLYKKTELGFPWIILVQLSSAYQQAINPMTVLKLSDTGGLEWLRGKPDSNGELTGPWKDHKTDILERAGRFSLVLEPV